MQVIYDPAKVSYETLLDEFWKMHSPTHESKGQYKSVIFHYTEEQKKLAEQSKTTQEEKLGGKIHTEILPAPTFWRAEDYHQDYYGKSGAGTCPR